MFLPFYIFTVFSHVLNQTFKQKIDHFAASDDRKFSQRYFVNFEYYGLTSTCPIILYLGGESELSPSKITEGTIVKIAKKSNALIVGLEHRFFGMSQPFNKLGKDELTYLTVDQALEDVAQFIVYLRNRFCLNNKCNVLTVGGSYAGSLSSWTRLYYPHLANFSWASSAPIRLIKEFPEYDSFVANILHLYHENCYKNVKLLFHDIQEAFDEGDTEKIQRYLNMFKIPLETDLTSSLYVISNIISYAVQYDNKFNSVEALCKTQMGKNYDLDAFVNFYFNLLKLINLTPKDIDPLTYIDEELNSSNAQMRAWTWMQCNELGWFSKSAGFQSPWINITFSEKICNKLFNITIGNVDVISKRYGGIRPRNSFVLFTQGSNDPWSQVEISSVDKTIAQHFFLIKGGSHCSDMYESKNDSSYVKAVKEEIVQILSDWLNDKCMKLCKMGKCLNDRCLCDKDWSGEYCTFKVISYKRFWAIGITSLMMLMVIIISIGGISWCIIHQKQKEQYLQTLHY